MAERGGGARVVGLDKRQLLARHRSGDPAAFPELVEIFQTQVFGYLARCGVRQGDQDDLFQEIFFSVHKSADRYDAKLPLEPWLFTIVVNAVRTYFRKIATQREDASESAPESVDPRPHPDQLQEASETAAWITVQLATLPLEQREALLLSYAKDMHQQDVANTLGISINTVKTHLRRGRLALLQKFKTRLRIVSEEAL